MASLAASTEVAALGVSEMLGNPLNCSSVARSPAPTASSPATFKIVVLFSKKKPAPKPKLAPGFKFLRTVRELKEGMVIKVEPGCYFIDALLVPAMANSKTAKFFNHEAINRFKDFAGVRIESDLYVTTNGCRNLTIPSLSSLTVRLPLLAKKGTFEIVFQDRIPGEPFVAKLEKETEMKKKNKCLLESSM